MSELKLFPYFRPKGSDKAPTCDDFTVKEDWNSASDGTAISTFTCGGQEFEAVKKGDGYEVKQNGIVLYTASASEDVYIIVDGTDGIARRVDTEQKAIDYFETKRKPEVAKTESSIVKLEKGDVLRVGGGVGYSTAKETTALPAGLQGESSSNDGRGMNGLDFFAEGRLFPFRLLEEGPKSNYFNNWLSPLNVSLKGRYSYGWLNDHYTADKGNSGNYQIGEASLNLGVELSARFFEQLFTGRMGQLQGNKDWDIFGGCSWELLGHEWLKGNWAHSGGSLPKDVDEGRWLSIFNGDVTHTPYLGFRYKDIYGLVYYIHDTGLGEKPEIHNNVVGVGAGYRWGGSGSTTTTKVVEGDKRVRLTKTEPVREEEAPAAEPLTEPLLLPVKVPAIPEKHALEAHEPIFIPAELKFKHKSTKLVEGEEVKLQKIITDISDAIKREYPDGIPEGYALYLTALGKASPEGPATKNQTLSGGRGKPTAELLFTELTALKEKGEEPFKNLVIDKDNFKAKGVGEMELVYMDGDKVVEVPRPYGGFENDGTNRTPAKGNIYKVCVGSSDPKISYKDCGTGTVMDIDMKLNRRVDIKIDVGPAKAVEEKTVAIVGADKVEAEKVVKGITGSPLFKDSNGFKQVYYSEKDNSIVIVLNEQGFENRENLMKGYTTKGKKKIPGLYEVVKGIKENPGSRLTEGCTIRFAAFYPKTEKPIVDYIKMLSDTFYSEDNYSNWPFNEATPTFSVIQTGYDKQKAADLVAQATNKVREEKLAENLGYTTVEAVGYKAAFIMVMDFAKLEQEEKEQLEFNVREMSKGGKVSLYIVSSTKPGKEDAERIVENARRINTAISNYYTAADENVTGDAKYIIVVSGADEPDLSSPDNPQMIELRKTIMDQVFLVK